MKLERLYVDIDGVVFDKSSFIDGHTLHICKVELEELVGNKVFSKVDIELACPSSSCRILNMGDIVQPTLKLDDEEATFPKATI